LAFFGFLVVGRREAFFFFFGLGIGIQNVSILPLRVIHREIVCGAVI
jgi:hypothetical protein